MNPLAFLPPSCSLYPLPSRRNARLYITGSSFLQRWKESAFYPAFRDTAKLYRFYLRVKSMTGTGRLTGDSSHFWPIREFVEECFPKVVSQAILIGTPGPAQKLVVQLWDRQHIVGYLKYGEAPQAQEHIIREAEVLRALPSGIAPALLKSGQLGAGQALVLAPIPGRPVKAAFPLHDGILPLLCSFVSSSPVELRDHPWIQDIEEHLPNKSWLSSLSHQNWPVVFHHGDFAPWNIIERPDKSLAVIDWEYGTCHGFPLLDLSFYLLQVGRLIYRWPPIKAKNHAITVLFRQQLLRLTYNESEALICLCAYQHHRRIRRQGLCPDSDTEAWWGAVWESGK